MSDTTETDRHVFDAYAEQAATVYSLEELPSDCVAVCDDALVNNASSPNPPDHVTIAGEAKVIRGRIVQRAYIVKPDG